MAASGISWQELQQLPYLGNFAFDETLLEKYIKEIKPSYNKANPATWPYITLDIINKHCDEYDGTRQLPRYVAYDPVVMKMFLSKNPLSYHDRYSFNFAPDGSLREPVHMTGEEYEKSRRRGYGPQQAAEDAERVNSRKKRYNPDSRTSHAPPIPQGASPSDTCRNPLCVSNARKVDLLTEKFADNNDELTSLKRRFKTMEVRFNDTVAKLIAANERATAAERALKQRAEVAEKDRKDWSIQAKSLEEDCTKLIEDIKRLRYGASAQKRAWDEQLEPDEKVVTDDKASKRAKVEDWDGEE